MLSLIAYFLLVWIATAVWEAKHYDKEERFRARFIRGLCCGQRRNAWHERCRVCRKHHYCEGCVESRCEWNEENPYIELRALGLDRRVGV